MIWLAVSLGLVYLVHVWAIWTALHDMTPNDHVRCVLGALLWPFTVYLFGMLGVLEEADKAQRNRAWIMRYGDP